MLTTVVQCSCCNRIDSMWQLVGLGALGGLTAVVLVAVVRILLLWTGHEAASVAERDNESALTGTLRGAAFLVLLMFVTFSFLGGVVAWMIADLRNTPQQVFLYGLGFNIFLPQLSYQVVYNRRNRENRPNTPSDLFQT